MLGLGIWALEGTVSFQDLVTDHSGVIDGVYTIIAAGSLLIVIGFFGCCGAIKENKCMLGVVSVHNIICSILKYSVSKILT